MATDFFERQDDARRQTWRLVALFSLAVALIVLAVYAVVTGLEVAGGGEGGMPPLFDPARLGIVATAVLLVITSGSLYKIAALRDGGEAVARMLGGRLVDPTTRAPDERRLLNVVEEMALASGTPVPPVYVLDGEPSINAFAAGFTPGDAVVAVSRGSLDRLSRDELQGVIAHEFSHILNGDMRLSLRLMGLVHGILVVALLGQILLRVVGNGPWTVRTSRDDDRKSEGGVVVALLVLGVALLVIGSIGFFFGRLIKAAVSRQREFLADASAVQFTRNPEGLAGALKKIGGLAGGSAIRSVNAEQACHLFFSQGVPSFTSLLATHPPLGERIRRLDPSFKGLFPETEGADFDDAVGAHLAALATGPGAAFTGKRGPRPLDPDEAVATVGRPTPAHVEYASDLLVDIPPALDAAAREPFSARALVFALLLDPGEAVRRAQLARLDAADEPGTTAVVLKLRPWTEAAGPGARIALVDLTFPALRRLSPAQYKTFRASVEDLVKADRRVSLFEYTLHRMLQRHLDRAFFRTEPVSVVYLSMAPLHGDAVLLLSTLARLGHDDEAGAAGAFAVGTAKLRRGQTLERDEALAPAGHCTLAAVDAALDRLARSAPEVKRRVLAACAACIADDGVVTPSEGELLRGISDSLDCPMPPLLDADPRHPGAAFARQGRGAETAPRGIDAAT